MSGCGRLLPMPNNFTAAHNILQPFLSRYSACHFLIGDTEFSPEKTSKTKRGGKGRKKKRERVKEGERERERENS